MAGPLHDRTARAAQLVERPGFLIPALVVAFTMIWLTGMTAAFSVSGCHQEDRPPERLVRTCSVAVVALNVLVAVLPGTKKEVRSLANVLLQRGLLRASLGRTEAAADLDRAIALATDGNGWPYRGRCHEWQAGCHLIRSMTDRVAREPEGSPGRLSWDKAVARSR